MKIEEMRNLWDLARIIHVGRETLVWGSSSRHPWPEFSTAYPHNPIAYVDLSLASAKAVVDNFKIDLSLAAGPNAQ